jgi:hypothetical protein
MLNFRLKWSVVSEDIIFTFQPQNIFYQAMDIRYMDSHDALNRIWNLKDSLVMLLHYA